MAHITDPIGRRVPRCRPKARRSSSSTPFIGIKPRVPTLPPLVIRPSVLAARRASKAGFQDSASKSAAFAAAASFSDPNNDSEQQEEEIEWTIRIVPKHGESVYPRSKYGVVGRDSSETSVYTEG
ncbi:hypothetical protein EIP91_010760 [Steccherinum ochraceum]|uniref:Uncharacterized protein n=1 Tax=Steccherinum ochraceum TaxID=92696 RepID=A0A4R0R2T2_9APHY|nr:hypothetical protein EIP91_010760 [Steccherinum ochraceum]